MPQADYWNPNLPVASRVVDLIERMTVAEKVAQLCGAFGWLFYKRTPDGAEMNDEGKARLSEDGIGGLYGLLRADPWTGVTAKTGLSPREGADLVNRIQAYVRENTRLGIPVFVIAEAGHGYMALGGTIGPSLMTASQTWNPVLWRKFMAATGAETHAQGNSVVFSPNIDLGRDPRWGRVEDTAGEVPFLASRFAEAAVAGLQSGGVAACVKHFVHGTPRGGLNTRPAEMGRHELHETYLRPFRAAIKAGTNGVMPSYNEIDGDPCSGSRWLLTDVLRDQLGFAGVTFSDVGALGMLVEPYRRAATEEEAAALALEAGIDFESSPTKLYDLPLKAALDSGLVPIGTLDKAVSRILTLKFELGLFEAEVDPSKATLLIGSLEHKDLALQVAREGIALLKNQGDLLPLSKDLKSVAVIGPNADNVYNQLGDYTPPQRPGETTTVLAGIRALLPKARIEYAKGCAIRDDSDAGMEQAVSIARNSDVTILVLGGSSARDFETDELNRPEQGAMGADRTSPDIDCGEGLDRATLGLLGRQLELCKNIHALGKPLAVVLMGGRPMEIEWIRQNVDAILFVGYPGQLGGQAIAEVLFGDHNPAGRLTMTWPKHVGQLPLNCYAKPTVSHGYLDSDTEPAFPFGHGLSYSAFEYSNLAAKAIGDSVAVSVTVKNTSKREGDDVVQLYMRDEVSSLTRPERELKGFARVRLKPGEAKTMDLKVGPEDLGFYDHEGKLRLEPGDFTFFVHDLSVTLKRD